MQTSAINCNRSLKTDRLLKSPVSWIFLASSAISFNSLLIALCQSNISVIGCVPSISETLLLGSKYFLLPVLDDSQGHIMMSNDWLMPSVESRWHFPNMSAPFLPSIQVKITFKSKRTNQLQAHNKTVQKKTKGWMTKEILPAAEAFLLVLSCLSISACPDIQRVRKKMKAMEGTLPSYSQECCIKTARLERLALLVRTFQ